MENKRIWAMVGVVYVVIGMLLTTYWIATTSLLTGLTGLLLFPLCAGMSVQCFNNRWKAIHQGAPGSPAVYLLLGLGCALGALLMLAVGIPQLIAQLS